jgi:hypothetical protein
LASQEELVSRVCPLNISFPMAMISTRFIFHGLRVLRGENFSQHRISSTTKVTKK